MRKHLVLLGFAAMAVVVLAQGVGAELLSSFVKALNSAQTLNVTYTVQPIGGAPETITLDLAKPNLAKIDRLRETVVADGKTITTYDKAAKTYYRQPQTPELLRGLFASHELGIWSSFFDANAYKTISRAAASGQKNRKGMVLNVLDLTIDRSGTQQVTMYLSQQDNVARQAEISIKGQGETETLIVDTKSLTLGGPSDPKQFEFKAPEGARELSWEEMNAGKWYTNLEEAKEVAARTKRLLFVDFYADW
ncbi:MAG TPA: hypothetical protein VM328_01160 [Fimbriimonadaceae bacterium]|nr:hypothetical protein [Fimbriimonadaceae bacterium]